MRPRTMPFFWLQALRFPNYVLGSFAVQGYTNDSTKLDGAKGVAVSGNYLYAAAFNADSLVVVDVTSPSNPSIAGSYSSSTYLNGVHSVAVGSSNFVYCSVYYAYRFTVVDVSSPSGPSYKGSVYSSYFTYASGLAISPLNSTIVFMVASYSRRLNAIDVVRKLLIEVPLAHAHFFHRSQSSISLSASLSASCRPFAAVESSIAQRGGLDLQQTYT